MSITIHREVGLSDVRPWGSWEVLDAGLGYKVKRINVRPHSRLSLQTHAHRSEHWMVVSGGHLHRRWPESCSVRANACTCRWESGTASATSRRMP